MRLLSLDLQSFGFELLDPRLLFGPEPGERVGLGGALPQRLTGMSGELPRGRGLAPLQRRRPLSTGLGRSLREQLRPTLRLVHCPALLPALGFQGPILTVPEQGQ